MQSAGRIYSDMVENQPSDGKRKSTHLALLRDAEGHREVPKDQDWRIKPPGLGKGRCVDDAQDRSMQASPNFRKAWADIQVADHLQK